MEITLNGIPISEEQCIGDSLAYINGAFITLKNAIIASEASSGSEYLKKTEFIGYFPNTGGIVYGGVQIGASTGINNAAILRFGKTVNSTDGELLEYLPTIFCGSSNQVGNDLFINTNSPNGKMFLRTGTPTARINSVILDSNGNVNMPTGSVSIGTTSTSVGAQKLEVVGGNARITNGAVPTLILDNSITNSIQWNSKISFRSNTVSKYELGVDPTQGGLNQFYLRDMAASSLGTDRFIIRNNGRVYIPGNVGIGIEPVAEKSLKIAGDLDVGGGITIAGVFSTAGITSTGPVGGTTGTYTGKVTTSELESSGAISGTTGTFSGKLKTTSFFGIESAGPVSGTTGTFTGAIGAAGGSFTGHITGTTAAFTGKVSLSAVESTGPISGTAITGTSYSGGSISGTTGTFLGKVTTTSLESSGLVLGASLSSTGAIFSAGGLTCNGITSNGSITCNGNTTIAGTLSSGAPAFFNQLSVNGLGTFGSFEVTNYITASAAQFSLGTFSTGLTAQHLNVKGGNAVIESNLTVTGAISCNSDIIAFQTSDIRLKKNVTVIPNALDKIGDIRGCQFEWDETLAESHLRGKSAGFIAQEVEKVFPEAVTTKENGYKAIRYEYILPLMLEAIKDLEDEIEKLKEKLYT